jgi:molybdopterin synthase catalytic subunit
MCRIVREPIDVRAVEAQVSDVSNGAVVTFVGQVRNSARGREVSYLEYDAYLPLAEKEILRIASEASERWQADVAVQHRLGRLELGEASVVVCTGCRHRGDAFEACRWIIDTLKERVPIWKRETCPDGTFWIEGDDAVAASP